jgi:hypothetical protein
LRSLDGKDREHETQHQAARIPQEYLGGIPVVCEKTERAAGGDERGQSDGGMVIVYGYESQQEQGDSGDTGGQAIQTVYEIHRIGGAHYPPDGQQQAETDADGLA